MSYNHTTHHARLFSAISLERTSTSMLPPIPPSIPADVYQSFIDYILFEWDSTCVPETILDYDLDEVCQSYPDLVRCRLPDGSLPLRYLLESGWHIDSFGILNGYGAEHDILTACASRNLPAVVKLLSDSPACLDQQDKRGNSPLHWFCLGRYAQFGADLDELASVLIAAGARTDIQNSAGLTPLGSGLVDGCELAACALVDAGVEPGFLFAVWMEDYDLLDVLLANDPNAIHWRNSQDNRTLLHLLLKWENGPQMVDYLLTHGANEILEVSRTTGRGDRLTPLLSAIVFEQYELAEALIRRGANVNAFQRDFTLDKCEWRGSPLHSAIRSDRIGLVELLLAHGADAGELSRSGANLLFEARSGEVTQVLLQAGVQADIHDQHGDTPLDDAIDGGKIELIKALLQLGVQPDPYCHVLLGNLDQVSHTLDNHPDWVFKFRESANSDTGTLGGIEILSGSIGGTPLHYACKAGNPEMVDLILKRGADINAATKSGWTPLHDAVYQTVYHDLRDGDIVIQKLVFAGASLDSRTWGGYTALDIAEYFSFRERSVAIFDLLLNLKHQ